MFSEEYAVAKAAIGATSNYYTVYDTFNKNFVCIVADFPSKAITYAWNPFSVN